LFVTIFPEVAQNSLSFPCSEKSPSNPGFPGLWPTCIFLTHGAVLFNWPTFPNYTSLGCIPNKWTVINTSSSFQQQITLEFIHNTFCS